MTVTLLMLAFALAGIGICLSAVAVEIYREVKVGIARWRIKRLR